MPRRAPLESEEMRMLAAWLDARGLLWFHAPNEARRSPAQGRRMKRLGLKAGVPDVLVFEPTAGGKVGCAIELKRLRGGRASEQQESWLKSLSERGWNVTLARGSAEAIMWLEMFYGTPPRA